MGTSASATTTGRTSRTSASATTTSIRALHAFPIFDKKRVFIVADARNRRRQPGGPGRAVFLQCRRLAAHDVTGVQRVPLSRHHAFLLNVEYRWEAFSGLDMALFGDWGNVAPTSGRLDWASSRTTTASASASTPTGSCSCDRYRQGGEGVQVLEVHSVQWSVLTWPFDPGIPVRYCARPCWPQPCRRSWPASRRASIQRRPARRGPGDAGCLRRAGNRPQRAVRLRRKLLPAPRRQDDQRAVNINTIDHVPDSSWFTQPAGTRESLIGEGLIRGPDREHRPQPGAWTIVSAKMRGHRAGHHDARQHRHAVLRQVRSAVESRDGHRRRGHLDASLFWALGFNVPENYLASLRRDNLASRHDTMLDDDNGRPAR